MQEARTPESGKIDLGDYEGRVIMMSCQSLTDIIYGAEVIDRATNFKSSSQKSI